jgi:hypothetical protein
MDLPSGPWTGFYNYGRMTRKHRIDLAMTFADHIFSGDGNDDIGVFVVSGRFDETNGECHWTKTYIGGHDVYYRGFREGIWGLWELPTNQAAFTYGHLGMKKATRIRKGRKSLRLSEQVSFEFRWGRRFWLHRLRVRAASTRD